MQDKRALQILKWLAIIAAGILLFLLGKRVAYIERGYKAVGGEYLLLLLPLLWLAVEQVIKDFRKMWRDAKETVDAEEEKG